jgi:NitT/TauT family transport system substrate-binding protein
MGSGRRIGKSVAVLLLSAAAAGAAPTSEDPPAPIPPLATPPALEAPAPYAPGADGVLDVELSEYAGYAGLVAANGGLDADPGSFLATKHGLRLRIRLSEESSWSALNAGRMAASATTVDVLAVHGRSLAVVVPAQIGWSRGADGIVVDRDIGWFNDLRGKVLASSRFDEADFFLRFLASEAGIPVWNLPKPDAPADPVSINVLYYADAFAAGDAFLADVKGGGRLSGCVTWAPRTGEVVEESGGKARILTTNRNLLVVADVLLVNRGFAEAHPGKVRALVEGLLEGNRRVREQPAREIPVVAKAFGWTPEEAKEELGRVHLANLPENLAFFAGEASAGGSYEGLYHTAVQCYGKAVLPDPPPPQRLLDLAHLEAIRAAGTFAAQKPSLVPEPSRLGAALERRDLLKRDLRFLFREGTADPDPAFAVDNGASLDSLVRLLRLAPGSLVRLRGFVDNAEYGKSSGGFEDYARDLSGRRAEAIRKLLGSRGVDPARIETRSTHWVENVAVGLPVPANRRVEASWMTLE